MSQPNSRILLFGATGYTGRITASLLTKSGAAPVLVGRNKSALVRMVENLSEESPAGRKPTYELADASAPESVRALLQSQDDVLISTVGPFARLGKPAVAAVVDAGAAYVDCSGEPTFIREMFESWGPKAQRTGARLLPAMGYDYAPGNLAAGLLLQRGGSVTGMDIGYFVRGPYTPSSGTMGTMGQIMLEPSYVFRDGTVQTERTGGQVHSFDLDGVGCDAVSMGGSEQFAIPAYHPALQNLDVYVGLAGRWSKAASAAGAITSNALNVPGIGQAMGIVMRAALGGVSDRGPAPHQRIKATSVVMAIGRDASGEQTGKVTVEGPNPYDLTGHLLAWSARMLSRRADKQVGTLGPVSAFGLDAYVAGCMALGLAQTD
jgi:short subunit dehydrogenase-like uncharacterized protein